jgi:hypothetical protein
MGISSSHPAGNTCVYVRKKEEEGKKERELKSYVGDFDLR